MDGERQRHRRIQMRARHAGRHVAAHRDRQPPRDVDRQGRSRGPFAQHRLSDDADAEHDQHERSQELRQHFARRRPIHRALLKAGSLKPGAKRERAIVDSGAHMPYILALDQGTTSSRAIVFDHDGGIRAVAQKEFTQIFPTPGGSSTTPGRSGRRQIGVAVEALGRAGLSPADIAAIGITNQRETTVVWDRKTGEPIHNAIVWQDRRTADFCERLKADGAGAMVQQKTGLLIDAYFSAKQDPLDSRQRARRPRESGRRRAGVWHHRQLADLEADRRQPHVTDVSNASRTMLFNIHTLSWDDELLALLRYPAQSAAGGAVVERGVRRPSTSRPASARFPLRASPAISRRRCSARCAVSRACRRTRMAPAAFCCRTSAPRRRRRRQQLVTTVAWQIGGRTEYALEGSVFIGGAVVQWIRDGLGLIRTAAEIEPLATSVPDNGGVYLVPAFAGLGAPHWDPYARGTIVGITRGTTAAHIARAALESIAFQVADLLDAMGADAGIPLKELRVDGGAANNNTLMQIQADLLGVPVVRPAVTETTALGAAYLAGLATGFWGSVDEITGQWRVDRRFEPVMARGAAAESRGRWQEAVACAKGWAR